MIDIAKGLEMLTGFVLGLFFGGSIGVCFTAFMFSRYEAEETEYESEEGDGLIKIDAVGLDAELEDVWIEILKKQKVDGT